MATINPGADSSSQINIQPQQTNPAPTTRTRPMREAEQNIHDQAVRIFESNTSPTKKDLKVLAKQMRKEGVTAEEIGNTLNARGISNANEGVAKLAKIEQKQKWISTATKVGVIALGALCIAAGLALLVSPASVVGVPFLIGGIMLVGGPITKHFAEKNFKQNEGMDDASFSTNPQPRPPPVPPPPPPRDPPRTSDQQTQPESRQQNRPPPPHPVPPIEDVTERPLITPQPTLTKEQMEAIRKRVREEEDIFDHQSPEENSQSLQLPGTSPSQEPGTPPTDSTLRTSQPQKQPETRVTQPPTDQTQDQGGVERLQTTSQPNEPSQMTRDQFKEGLEETFKQFSKYMDDPNAALFSNLTQKYVDEANKSGNLTTPSLEDYRKKLREAAPQMVANKQELKNLAVKYEVSQPTQSEIQKVASKKLIEKIRSEEAKITPREYAKGLFEAIESQKVLKEDIPELVKAYDGRLNGTLDKYNALKEFAKKTKNPIKNNDLLQAAFDYYRDELSEGQFYEEMQQLISKNPLEREQGQQDYKELKGQFDKPATRHSVPRESTASVSQESSPTENLHLDTNTEQPLQAESEDTLTPGQQTSLKDEQTKWLNDIGTHLDFIEKDPDYLESSLENELEHFQGWKESLENLKNTPEDKSMLPIIQETLKRVNARLTTLQQRSNTTPPDGEEPTPEPGTQAARTNSQAAEEQQTSKPFTQEETHLNVSPPQKAPIENQLNQPAPSVEQLPTANPEAARQQNIPKKPLPPTPQKPASTTALPPRPSSAANAQTERAQKLTEAELEKKAKQLTNVIEEINVTENNFGLQVKAAITSLEILLGEDRTTDIPAAKMSEEAKTTLQKGLQNLKALSAAQIEFQKRLDSAKKKNTANATLEAANATLEAANATLEAMNLKEDEYLDKITEYVVGYSDLNIKISKILSKNPKIKEIIQKNVNESYSIDIKQDLGSLLITPVQRGPRYILLVTDIEKRLPGEYNLSESAKQSISIIKSSGDNINNAKRISELNQILDKVDDNIKPEKYANVLYDAIEKKKISAAIDQKSVERDTKEFIALLDKKLPSNNRIVKNQARREFLKRIDPKSSSILGRIRDDPAEKKKVRSDSVTKELLELWRNDMVVEKTDNPNSDLVKLFERVTDKPITQDELEVVKRKRNDEIEEIYNPQ